MTTDVSETTNPAPTWRFTYGDTCHRCGSWLLYSGACQTCGKESTR